MVDESGVIEGWGCRVLGLEERGYGGEGGDSTVGAFERFAEDKG